VEELEFIVHEGRWMMFKPICPIFWLQEMHLLGDSFAHCFGIAGKQFMEL
jgi:hypothetical protein